MKKIILVITILVAILFLKLHVQKDNPQMSTHHKVRVYRDEHGIPHIIGRTKEAIAFGTGYAEAQDRLWNIYFKKKLVKGELAEMFGSDILESDMEARNYAFFEVGKMNAKLLDQQTRGIYQAYADGMNSYARKAKILPFQFYVFWTEWQDWTIEDAAAIHEYMSFTLDFDWMYQLARQRLLETVGFSLAQKIIPFGEENLFREVTIINDQELKERGRYIPHYPDYQDQILKEHWAGKNMSLGSVKLPTHQVPGTGSNSWVIGGQHTQSGNPILANDPHLANLIPSIFYLIEMTLINDKNETQHSCFGASINGMFAINMGVTKNLAWGATASYVDNKDVYYQTIRKGPDNQSQYLFEGQWKDFRIRQETFKVKFGEDVTVQFFHTHRGPVIQHIFMDLHWKYGFPLSDKYKNNYALSIDCAIYDPDADSLKAFADLTFARNYDEFIHAGLNINSPNIDSSWILSNGSFGFTSVGRIPKRKIPEMGSFIKDGNSSLYDMGEYLNSDERPKLWDPKKGFVAMCNNKFAEDGFDFRASLHQITNGRSYRLNKIITQKIAKKQKFNFDDMIKMQLDVKDEFLSEVFPGVLKAIYSVKSLWTNQKTQKFHSMLSKWDYEMPKNSIEASFYHVWERHFQSLLLKSFDFSDQEREAIVNHAFFEVYQMILFEKMGNGSLGEQEYQVCQLPQNQNLSHIHPCLYNAAISFSKLPEQLSQAFGSGDISEYRWGKLHATKFKSIPWSKVPLMDKVFGRSTETGGNSRTLNVGIHTHQSKSYNALGGPVVRLITDLNRTLFSFDTGQNQRPWSPFYDNFLGKDNFVEYVHKNPLVENGTNWEIEFDAL